MNIKRIPQRDVQALEAIAALSPQDFDGFVDAVRKTAPAIGRANFVVQIVGAAAGLQRTAADELMRAVLGMQAARIAWEATAEEFAQALAAAENVAESKVLSQNSDLWRQRLINLLSTESVYLAAKAATVLTAHEHPFESASIYTDIRPIFAEGVSESGNVEPTAAVLVHHLRLRLGGENQPRELDVALDNRDLEALAKVVERAKRKAAALAEAIKLSNLRHMEPPED
ncbi:MAG: hypothetical protein ACP5O1_12470 [Phycisphaerae bacterium]